MQPHEPECPPHWIKGQLLDLRRFTDGSYRCCLAHEVFGHKDTQHLEFESADAAQQFVSYWYEKNGVAR